MRLDISVLQREREMKKLLISYRANGITVSHLLLAVCSLYTNICGVNQHDMCMYLKKRQRVSTELIKISLRVEPGYLAIHLTKVSK